MDLLLSALSLGRPLDDVNVAAALARAGGRCLGRGENPGLPHDIRANLLVSGELFTALGEEYTARLDEERDQGRTRPCYWCGEQLPITQMMHPGPNVLHPDVFCCLDRPTCRERQDRLAGMARDRRTAAQAEEPEEELGDEEPTDDPEEELATETAPVPTPAEAPALRVYTPPPAVAPAEPTEASSGKQDPRPDPAPLLCSGFTDAPCGKLITKGQHGVSIRAYGSPYCPACQKEANRRKNAIQAPTQAGMPPETMTRLATAKELGQTRAWVNAAYHRGTVNQVVAMEFMKELADDGRATFERALGVTREMDRRIKEADRIQAAEAASGAAQAASAPAAGPSAPEGDTGTPPPGE